MAVNWQTFKTRALTAVVFVAVMAVGLLWNRWSFFLLFSLIHFGCWIEYNRLVQKINKHYTEIHPLHKYGMMLAGWCLLLYFTNNELAIGRVRLTGAGWWLGLAMLFVLPVALIMRPNGLLKNLGYSLVGLFYISLPLGLLIYLRNLWDEERYQLSLTVPLLLIFTLWVNDTMAYLVGSLMGKTPLSSISPKKTWEGTIGGIVLAVGAMCWLAYLTGRLSIAHTAVMALLVAVGGTFGDLFESKLKRMAGVKDSGHLMPGHGGFLDRFDSLLFASVPAWLYAQFFI